MNTKYIALGIMGLVGLSLVCPSAQAQLTSFTGGDASVGGLPPGAELTRHWIVGDNATCNDGTTPAAYVRAGSGADSQRWVVHLQGGGSCRDGEDCLNRWQSFDSNYGIQKMSTSIPQATWNSWYPGAPAPSGWTAQGADYAIPETAGGRGIFSPNAANPFRDWNHVHLYYCSSDEHSGQISDQTAAGIDELGTPPAIPAGTSVSYLIHFRGADIFDQLISDLRAGLTYFVNGEPITMNSLDTAEMTLLTGSSAGGNGVKHHLDRLRAEQLSINPNSQVRGVIDAAGSPSAASLPWPVAPAPVTSYQQHIEERWNDAYQAFWLARTDESCQLLNPAPTTVRCGDSTHVLRHHLTTPFFHRMDLQDSVAMRPYQGIFYPSPPYAATVAPMQLAFRIDQQLFELDNLTTLLTPRYPTELATIAADPDWLVPGIFGPRCTTHVGLTGNGTFFGQQLPDSGGVPHSYADSLWQWVSTPGGGIPGPALIASPGIGSAGLPFCP